MLIRKKKIGYGSRVLFWIQRGRLAGRCGNILYIGGNRLVQDDTFPAPP